MRIIFIRHGRTNANVNHLLDTNYPGTPLDEVGLDQAAGLPGRLVSEPIEVVMTSDITRARQTGEPLAKAKGVPLIIHPGVREIYAGDWDMAQDWRDYIAVLEGWALDPSLSTPNGEDGFGFMARFDAAIAELGEYRCAAVVSHGGALGTWFGAHCPSQIDLNLLWRLGNTEIVVVEGTPGQWRIRSWADRLLS